MTSTLIRKSAGILLAAAAFALIPPGGCVCVINGGPPLQQRTASLTAPHESGQGLEVRAHNGSVTIHRAAASEVTMQAVLKMTSDERLEATTIAANRQPDGTLLIEASPPEGKWLGNEGCSFEVTVPDASGVRVTADNGRIEIEGLAGDADLTTSNGAIVAQDHRGRVHAHTSNGAIKITGVHGAVDAETSNGSVTVTQADDAPGPVSARTSNGSIDLRLGPAFAGTLELATSNGSVRCPEGPSTQVRRHGKSAAVLTIGEGGTTSKVHTSNGSITVSR